MANFFQRLDILLSSADDVDYGLFEEDLPKINENIVSGIDLGVGPLRRIDLHNSMIEFLLAEYLRAPVFYDLGTPSEPPGTADHGCFQYDEDRPTADGLDCPLEDADNQDYGTL